MLTRCLFHTGQDPYFNLATEEYLLKNFTDDFLIIWQSERSVVVGKHQNALAEINHAFVRQNNIPVARRLSGGGTVFHDRGNVNFTFIKTVEKLSEVDFSRFIQPVVAALNVLGVEAYTTGRNDLMIDGKKISGNAEHVFKNRVLHHGTLLYDSQLGELRGALKVDLSRFEDKSVQSNRSPVTNISDYLSEKMPVDMFARFIFNELKNNYVNAVDYELSEADRVAIHQLRDEKYAIWDWIYGYSPRYTFSNALQTEHQMLKLEMKVEKGIIREVSAQPITHLLAELIGHRHCLEELEPLVMQHSAEISSLLSIPPKELLNVMF